MDFHSLTRKELQTLCKKNKIPANITNVGMADALSALPQVEGLDEFLNPTEAEAGAATLETHRTTARTSTTRKALKEEPKTSKVVSSQKPKRSTRGGGNDEGVVAEQENKDANVLFTPTARKRATAASSRRKKEPESVEDDEKNGPSAAVPSSRKRATGRSVSAVTEGTSVQRAYNTRRSVRFLEKNMSKMSLVEAEDTGLPKVEDVSEEKSSVSQQIEDSADTEEVASLKAVSSVVSEETYELEVSSLEKKTDHEHVSGSEVLLVSGAENDVGADWEAEPQEEDLGKVDCLVADSEPHDLNLQMEDSSETHEDSNEVIEWCDVPTTDMNNSIGETVQADDVTGSVLLSELEGSSDSSDSENKVCPGTKQDALSLEPSEDASVESDEHDVAALIVEASKDASVELTEQNVAAVTVVVKDFSIEVTDQDVAGLPPLSPVSKDSPRPMELLDDADNQGSNEVDYNQDKNNETEHLIVADGDRIPHFQPVNHVGAPAADDETKLANICSSGEHEEESEAESENSEEESEAESENFEDESEAESENLEEESAADETKLANICSSGEHEGESEVESENAEDESEAESENFEEESEAESEILEEESEAESEDSEESMAEVEEMDNPSDVMDVFDDSTAEESTKGENFTLESPLLDDHNETEPVNPVVDEAAADEKNLVVIFSSGKNRAEESEVKLENTEESMAEMEKMDNVSDVVVVSSPVASEEDNANIGYENSVDVINVSNDDSSAEESNNGDNVTLESPLLDDHKEELEAKSMEEAEKIIDGASDAENSFAATETCAESVADVLNVSLAVQESEEQKDDKSNEHAAAAETAFDATSAFPYELKASEIPIQSFVAEQSKGDESLFPSQSETKAIEIPANEVQVAPKMINAANMKENLTKELLQKKSMRELKKMMKKLKIVDDNSTCNSKTSDNVVKEVEKKRTALQALPGNQMTKAEAHTDG